MQHHQNANRPVGALYFSAGKLHVEYLFNRLVVAVVHLAADSHCHDASRRAYYQVSNLGSSASVVIVLHPFVNALEFVMGLILTGVFATCTHDIYATRTQTTQRYTFEPETWRVT